MNPFIISATGCVLLDYLYNEVSLHNGKIIPYLSKAGGDGGISPGKLVFTGELERFAAKSYPEILQDITGGKKPDSVNIGGPGIVSMIHLRQMSSNLPLEVNFTGAIGKDEPGLVLRKLLSETPLDPSGLLTFSRTTPFTHVLSDPGFDGGHGERSFINNLGAAEELTGLPAGFFAGDMAVFGGTALVPGLHDKLDIFLGLARKNNMFTVVNTVYDFRNQKLNPSGPWPLGKSHDCLANIDLLIMDLEEALRISGKENRIQAMDYFIKMGTKAVIMTDGPRDICLFASAETYNQDINRTFPVSERVTEEIKSGRMRGDTTGCGDNFAGGIIASLAEQLLNGIKKPDIKEALAWGVASGGFTCSYLGGTFFEKKPGEKKSRIREYYLAYLDQISH